MKRFIAIVALAFAVAAPAAAQDVTDASGRVRVTLESSWRVLQPSEYMQGQQDALFVVQQDEEYSLASCELTRHVQQLPQPQTRARLNEATEALRTSPVVENYRQTPGVTIESVEITMLNGIAVLDIRQRRRALVAIERRLFVQSPGELELFTLGCSAHPEDTEAVAQAFAVADSLWARD